MSCRLRLPRPTLPVEVRWGDNRLWLREFETPREIVHANHLNEPLVAQHAKFLQAQGDTPPNIVAIFTNSQIGDKFPYNDILGRFCGFDDSTAGLTVVSRSNKSHVAWLDERSFVDGTVQVRNWPGPVTLDELRKRLMTPVSS
jgi:hypothetical protein